MTSEAITPENIHAYLRKHQEKELCRFVTVGSVDDGKSTLIGRLLHDTHGIYEDQLAAVKKATKQEGEEVDFSLFTDGLKAEREQGITIDVAYRYFSTEKRKFIIADTPGHVQYTRNMATGASTANVAIILIDSRLGVLQQSRRHAYIAHLLGIPHLAVCINKMDLVEFSEEVFNRIRDEFSAFTGQLGFREVKFIPISATKGINVVHGSDVTPWYPKTTAAGGGTLLEFLETVPVDAGINRTDFRFPIQYVIRPNLDYRGFSGTIASGSVKKGDTVITLPSRQKSRIRSIDTFDGEIERAAAPMAVTIRLEDEIDSSRGDMMVLPGNEPQVLERFEAKMVWLSENDLDRSHTYLMKHTTQLVRANVDVVNYVVDLETLEKKNARHLALNDIGSVAVTAHKAIYLDSYQKNHVTGAFILIDPITNNTVAAGMIEGPVGAHGARRGERLESKVGPAERLERMGQAGAVVWLTGLPAAGKSAIAYELERQLFDRKMAAVVLDPEDNATRTQMPDGSSPAHSPELALRLADAGLLTICAYASPHRADRMQVRSVVGAERFVEVYVSTSVEVCRTRDERGAYDGAHVDPIVSYEVPQEPDLKVSLDGGIGPKDAARAILSLLVSRGLARE